MHRTIQAPDGWRLRLAMVALALSASFNARAQDPQTPVDSHEQAPAADSVIASPAAGGTLEINTGAAGAPVFLDGQAVGVTPLKLTGVAAGVHKVRVEAPGTEPWEREQTVVDGGLTRVELDQLAATPPPAPAPSPAAPRRNYPKLAWGFFLAIPWAFMATGISVATLLTWAVLWSSAPVRFPSVGRYRLSVDERSWRVVQWSPLVVSVVFGAVAAVLYLVPAVPLSRLWAAPPAEG